MLTCWSCRHQRRRAAACDAGPRRTSRGRARRRAAEPPALALLAMPERPHRHDLHQPRQGAARSESAVDHRHLIGRQMVRRVARNAPPALRGVSLRPPAWPWQAAHYAPSGGGMSACAQLGGRCRWRRSASLIAQRLWNKAPPARLPAASLAAPRRPEPWHKAPAHRCRGECLLGVRKWVVIASTRITLFVFGRVLRRTGFHRRYVCTNRRSSCAYDPRNRMACDSAGMTGVRSAPRQRAAWNCRPLRRQVV